MADPKPKSLEPPYLWRIPTIWQMPQWQQANVWRWFVYNQPIAMLCRQHLINHLQGLPQEVVARDPDDQEKYQDDCDYYNKWVLADFDNLVDLFLQDFLDLPVGGNAEVTRWPIGVKPDIRVGGETYRVTGDHPKGHPFEIVPIDGSTLFPTYDKDLPMAQRIPELEKVVYFNPDEIMRIGWQSRTEMRLKGYYKAPPEQVYLAIQMVNDTDHYYNNLVKEVPPIGILDLMDKDEYSAMQWAGSVRALFEGSDPFKIPILYEHTTPANFIPFGKSPQELLMDTAGLRYGRTATSSYGLTLGNLGLEPKGETLGGSIRDDKQAGSGKSFVVEKTKGVIDKAILPPYLEWKPQVTDYEELIGKGRAFLVFAQALRTTKDAGALKPSEMQAQLKRDGFITIEAEVPNDEELAKQAQMGGGKFKQGFGGGRELQNVMGRQSPSRGGLGDVKRERALLAASSQVGEDPLLIMGNLYPGALSAIQKAQARANEAHTDMAETLKSAFSKLNSKATRTRLDRLAVKIGKVITPLIGKADLPDDLQERLDAIIAGENWYNLTGVIGALAQSYRAAYSEGATVAAEEVLRYLAEHALLDSSPVTIDFTLTNPRTLAELEEKAALLVRRIDDGTRYYLKRMLVSGVEEGLPSDEIARRVKAELEGMTLERIESIVNTEINRAESEGRLGQWSEMGLTKKAWKTFGEACPLCRGNEAKGFVEMAFVYDDVFDGTLTPPAHPQICRCHLVFDEDELLSRAGELTVWGGD